MSEEYEEGRHAASIGLMTEDNPYAHGSRQADNWEDGWWSFYINEDYR